MARLVATGVRLVTNLLPVPPRVRAERMREGRSAVHGTICNVVGELALLRIESGEMANALGDFMIGARRVAADAEPSDARLVLVQRHAAAERNLPAAHLTGRRVRLGGSHEAVALEGIR